MLKPWRSCRSEGRAKLSYKEAEATLCSDSHFIRDPQVPLPDCQVGLLIQPSFNCYFHEFHETCHSITFLFDKKRLQTMLWHHYARVNSHQRWKQTLFCVCYHLRCELTIAMNVTEWQVSWNSWKSFFGRKILDFEIFAPPSWKVLPPLEIFLATPLLACQAMVSNIALLMG